jgi:hypothetical protein
LAIALFTQTDGAAVLFRWPVHDRPVLCLGQLLAFSGVLAMAAAAGLLALSTPVLFVI